MRPWVMAAVLAAGMMLCGASAAEAQRRIDVPATARWQHARSGVILPTAIGNYRRVGIVDTTQNEVDVLAHYEADGGRITVILFRPQIPDIGLWFDRSEQVLARNPTLVGLTPIDAAPVPVVPAGLNIASGLRRSYTSSGAMRTTATAMIPVGRWILKVRISSPNADAAAIDALMDATLAAVRLPEGGSDGVAARVIGPCSTARPWPEASEQPIEVGSVAAIALLQQLRQGGRLVTVVDRTVTSGDEAVADAVESRLVRPPYLPADACRDSHDFGSPLFAAYRGAVASAPYWITLNDNGPLLEIAAERPFDAAGAARHAAPTDAVAGTIAYNVVALMPERTLVFGQFAGVPSPQQVADHVNGRSAYAILAFDPEAVEPSNEVQVFVR